MLAGAFNELANESRLQKTYRIPFDALKGEPSPINKTLLTIPKHKHLEICLEEQSDGVISLVTRQ